VYGKSPLPPPGLVDVVVVVLHDPPPSQYYAYKIHVCEMHASKKHAYGEHTPMIARDARKGLLFTPE
jgi:hypothetical protein